MRVCIPVCSIEGNTRGDFAHSFALMKVLHQCPDITAIKWVICSEASTEPGIITAFRNLPAVNGLDKVQVAIQRDNVAVYLKSILERKEIGIDAVISYQVNYVHELNRMGIVVIEVGEYSWPARECI